MREVPFGNDGDYSRENFITRINAELANNIGNLAQRSLTMIYKNCQGKIPASSEYSKVLIEPYAKKVFAAMKEFAFDKALFAICEFSTLINQKFNKAAPWQLKKEGKIAKMNAVLYETAESIRLIAILLTPFIPASANKILDLLNIEESQKDFSALNNALKAEHQINEPKAIFPRLEDK